MIPPLLISHCPTYEVPKNHNESSSSFFLGCNYLRTAVACVPLCKSTHPCTNAHTRAHPRTPSHTRTHPLNTYAHPHTPGYTPAHLCTPAHTQVDPHTPVHTCAHPCTPRHTRTHPTHTHWCPLIPLTWQIKWITCKLKNGGKRDRERDRKKKEQESAEAISGLKKTYSLMSCLYFCVWIKIHIHIRS